ncbi:MAG: hypothetical protein PHN82_09200 [bacterium]|nr:hypothetical protein [bacterium]
MAAGSRPWTIGRLAAVFAVSSAAALALFAGYRFLFPHRAGGACLYCGGSTPFGPRGWGAFCIRHAPLAPLPPLMIIVEAASLFAATLSLWFMLRALFTRGVPRAFIWIVGACAAAMLVCALFTGGGGFMRREFILGAGFLLFVLSAAYVESIESMVMVTAVAVFLAFALALLIHALRVVLFGYMGILS